MKAKEVYEKLHVSPNLQRHMLRVAKIADLIVKNWTGPNIDGVKINQTALLHDVGNIVKFDLEKYPEFLEEERGNIEYWKKIQIEMIQKYGSDDHEATCKMLIDLGVNQSIIEIIQQKSFENSVKTSKSNNWELKIMFYTDLRALPQRVGTLEERLKDVTERLEKYRNRPDIEELFNACRKIEKDIEANMKINASDIKDESLEGNDIDLLEKEV